jgi:hypothetical protein
MSKCKCGNEAVDNLQLTNKQGDTLTIPFCEEHRTEVEKAISMLYAEGMNEL